MKAIKTQIQFTYEWWQGDDDYSMIDEHRERLDEHAVARINEMSSEGFTCGELEEEIDEICYSGFWEKNTVRLAEPHQKTTNE